MQWAAVATVCGPMRVPVQNSWDGSPTWNSQPSARTCPGVRGTACGSRVPLTMGDTAAAVWGGVGAPAVHALTVRTAINVREWARLDTIRSFNTTGAARGPLSG